MVSVASPAKVNLFLEVTGKRPDGYHDIESVFLAVAFGDRLAAEVRGDGELSLGCDVPGPPPGADNLIVKAADLLRRTAGSRSGMHFRLEKRIPMGSGLGGGSSNAAAALILANRLWRTGLGLADLAPLAARLGSDIPFFLHGGACLCRGRGEIIECLPPFPPEAGLVLVLPNIHSDTAGAYRGLALPRPGAERRADAFVAALRGGDVCAMASLAFNRFEETVFAAIPVLGEMHAALSRANLAPRLSGSGSGLWFFGGGDEAGAAREALAGFADTTIIGTGAFAAGSEAGTVE